MYFVAKDKLGISIILLTLLAIFFVIPQWQTAIISLMWLAVVSFCLLNLKERLLLLLFQATLFTFLMTRLIFPTFFSTEYIVADAGGTIRMFSAETLRFIYTTIAISIFGSYAGYVCVSQREETNHALFDTTNSYVVNIRRMSKLLSYFCSIFYVALIIEKALFVIRNGYFAMFAEFESQLPGLITTLSHLYSPLLFLFLATFPSKQEARPPLWLYAIIAILSLSTGSRTGFMLALVFLIFYFCLRNIHTPEDPWLSRKAAIGIIALIPALFVFMFMIDFIRADREMDGSGIFSMFINFFYQQGISAQVLGLSYEMQYLLGDRIFSFGQIIDNFNKNFIFQIMGTAVEYRPQTEEMAQYGHSLANTITYYAMYKSFLSGVGLGTSYIAEVWHDFGYVGLLLWNMMYGFFFAKFYKWSRQNIWACAFGLIIIPDIIYSPRGHAGAFLNVFFSISILLTFLIIHILAKRFSKQ